MVNVVTQVLKACCIVLMLLLLSCVLWQVISRYLLAAPSTITDEFARFTFIWLALLGAALAYHEKAHLAVDYFVHKFPLSAQRGCAIFSQALCAGFALFVMVLGGGLLMNQTLASGQVSPVMGLPMGLFYFCLPLSGSLIFIFACANMLTLLRARTH